MERNIKVTGRGKVSVKPDTIRLNIEASGIYKEYDKAVKTSAEETGILREVIARAGLDPKDLKTVNFGIDSEYENYHDRHDNYKRSFVGYKYTHSMYIQFPNDSAQLGKVLYELAKGKKDVEFSIMHTVRDVEAVKNELLAKAVEDSRAKAEILANAAGVSPGKIRTIDYSWGELEIYSRPMSRMMLAEADLCETGGSYDIDIEADDINVQDTVTIVWDI